jgi:protein-disulfide isomerase
MSKQFLAIVIAIILVFVGIGVYSSKSNKTDNKGSQSSLSQHITGNPKSKVTIIEYGDYQCPYCQAYSTSFKAAQAQFGDKAQFQFRNYPLTSLHKNAMAAARAAEAASLQGKFWEMHDALYDNANWSSWTKAGDPQILFNAYAQQLGLNVSQFKTDFASKKLITLLTPIKMRVPSLAFPVHQPSMLMAMKKKLPIQLLALKKSLTNIKNR